MMFVQQCECRVDKKHPEDASLGYRTSDDRPVARISPVFRDPTSQDNLTYRHNVCSIPGVN